MHGLKVLSFTDNMSCLLAFDKGWARHPSLNGVVSPSRSERDIECEITWRGRHIMSEASATDWGSRAADRGEPQPGQRRQGCAPWLREVEEYHPLLAGIRSSRRRPKIGSSAVPAPLCQSAAELRPPRAVAPLQGPLRPPSGWRASRSAVAAAALAAKILSAPPHVP